MLEEAACELFLENTYAGTTIEQIAARAGVSRNTFFNYFDAKSDVLWAGVDDAIDALTQSLAAHADGQDALAAVRTVLIGAATWFGPGQLPLAVTQYDVMGAQDELKTSGLPRFLRLADAVERFLVAGTKEINPDAARAKVIAFALVAAVAAAGSAWAGAGPARHPLSEYVAEAITPICRGFTR
jgi:AcrR family transcriptional regulator